MELLWQNSNEHICIVKLKSTSSYFRHILTLLSGTAFAQVVLLVALPFLTRLFSPEDFGLYGVFVAATSIIGMVANGRFDLAILIPKAEEDALSVYRLCYQFAIGISLILVMLCLVIPEALTGIYHELIWWIPLSVFLQGLLQPASRWLLRKRKFKIITISKIAGSLITVSTSIVLAFYGYGFKGLVLGKIGGQLVDTIISGGFRVLGFNPVFREALMFKRFNGFLKFSSFEALLNTFFKQIPVFALSGYFSEAMAGFYTLAMNVTSRPSGMVSQSVSQVFFKEASEMSPGGLPSFFLKNVKWLFALIIIPALLVVFFGESLFGFLFGDEWVKSGYFAAWLMPFVVITFIKAGVSPVLDLKNKMRYNLLFEIGFVCISLFSFYLAWMNNDGEMGVISFSVGNSILGCLQLGAFYSWSKSKSGFQ